MYKLYICDLTEGLGIQEFQLFERKVRKLKTAHFYAYSA